MKKIYEISNPLKKSINEFLAVFFITVLFLTMIFTLIMGLITDSKFWILSSSIFIIILITLLIFVIYLIITSKNFIIYDNGIQYITKSVLYKNYKDNFIPFSKVKEIRIRYLNRFKNVYNLEFIDDNGRKAIIPHSAIVEIDNNNWEIFKDSLKTGFTSHKDWAPAISMDTIINLWNSGKEGVVKEVGSYYISYKRKL